MPHRAELWSSLEQIKNAGWERWFADMSAMTPCPECGSRPSSRFAEKNSDLMKRYMGKLRRE